jgi:pimeloyl-ACP methyl ester carboxylesterase
MWCEVTFRAVQTAQSVGGRIRPPATHRHTPPTHTQHPSHPPTPPHHNTPHTHPHHRPGRPLLALELPHISMRWVLWVPTLDEVVEALLTILKREHAPSACLVGHSYGTAVASRLLQTQPQAVQQLCLIDPVRRGVWGGGGGGAHAVRLLWRL